MKNLVIIGAGGFGRETALMVNQIRSWNLLGFYDDQLELGTIIEGKPVLGKVSLLNENHLELAVVIAIADPTTRQRIAFSLSNKKLSFPSIFHPTALSGHMSNSFGKGCIITAGVILTTGITIGDFVIVNLATTIGHDTHIGDFTSIMPQCSISGNVKLGKKCFLGSGTRILQGLTLGDNSIVGAGAVVTKSFAANSKLIGIPAKRIQMASNN